MQIIISKKAIAAGFSLMTMAFVSIGHVMANEKTQSLDLSSFERIVIQKTGIALDVNVGRDFSVTLKGSEKWLAKIDVNVADNALVIGRKDGKRKSTNFDSDNKIIVTMPKFSGLEVNGAVDAHISGVDSDSLAFDVNGAGNIEVKGKCGRLKVDLNGAGNFSGRGLKCETVAIDINGAGNVEAYGTKSADLDINGMGNIDLYGNPQEIIKDKSWFSNITIHK